MQEILMKTHLIVTDTYDDYNMKWCGKIMNTKPKLKNGKPIFIIVGGKGRVELNTTDTKRLEKYAKALTQPRGREAVTTDSARIYILEENGKETLMGSLIHSHIKVFAPMFDKVQVGEK